MKPQIVSSRPQCCFFYPPSLPSVQAKLEEALALATDFQNSLQDFINWLTLAEQSLNIVPPPSLILNAVLAQIDEHKVRALWAPSGCWDAGSEHGTGTLAMCSRCSLSCPDLLTDRRMALLFAGVRQ